MSKAENGTTLSVKAPVWNEDDQDFQHQPPEIEGDFGYDDLLFVNIEDLISSDD